MNSGTMRHQTLLPGQPGIKHLLKKYCEDLVCVRYRYNVTKKQKIKTIELVVDQQAGQPDNNKVPPNKLMNVRIEYGEIDLASKVKSLGGRWNRQKRVWEVPYRYVVLLGIEDRIVRDL